MEESTDLVLSTSSHEHISTPFSQKSQKSQNPFSGTCPSLIHIPVDIFIEICGQLPHGDLLNLMCTCRQFRYWLNSTTSYITQDIWRTSRKKFGEYMKLDPP